MLHRTLFLLLLSSLAAVAQTQYSMPSAARSGSPIRSQRQAQKVCPWLTEGSAAKALDGDVSVTVDVSNQSEGSCRFSRQRGSSDVLQIAVAKTGLPGCPAAGVKLTGIGNEAERCRIPSARGEFAEMVRSRVREMYFTVTLIARGQKKSTAPENDALEQIAEQVAGNLY